MIRVRSMPLPMYPELPLGLPDSAIRKAIAEFRPDIIHLASPIVIGRSGLKIAEKHGIPTVAVYQTDVVGFAQQYGFVGVERTIWAWTRRLYARAGRTLAPSQPAVAQLEGIGVPRVFCWRRGVDLAQFDPSRRDDALRARLAPNGEVLIGYVGRVATEKRVHLLRHLDNLDGIRLVVVGDGPALEETRAVAPRAAFLGMLRGAELAKAIASLDVFVHTGAHETFCQAAQEAMASGVPPVAPAAGGLLDLVDPGRTGLLYAPEDSEAGIASMRAAARTLADDAALRLRMGDAARRSVLRRDWSHILDELIDVHYKAVLQGNGTRATGLVA
ncbi:glycosyltransferase family 1 protein [Flindersiella endophytica]